MTASILGALAMAMSSSLVFEGCSFAVDLAVLFTVSFAFFVWLLKPRSRDEDDDEEDEDYTEGKGAGDTTHRLPFRVRETGLLAGTLFCIHSTTNRVGSAPPSETTGSRRPARAFRTERVREGWPRSRATAARTE